MLKALELVGFKSFADRTRFEFPPGVTVVVGPNGSGKSNIVDAMKWALGEQSVKSLRGQEMADVIFNGSGARRAMNSAEITLTFDNAARLLAIDTPEVHITRRVYRSGEGEYLINRAPARLRDIRELLSGTGMGTQAYSVIEQGKVDVLLQSSPRDRRVIFEEAAGISRFKLKKLEALRRLERVDQNLLRLRDIVDEVENQLRGIRNQANKARRYKEHVDRLQELRTQVALGDWRKLSEHIAAAENEVAQQQQQRDSLLAAAELAEARVLESDARLAELGGAMRSAELATAHVRERIAAQESAIEHERARLVEREQEIDQLRKQWLALSARDGSLAQQLQQTVETVQAAEADHRQASMRLAESERLLTELIAKLDRTRTEFEASRSAYLDQLRAAGALTAERSALESRLTATATQRDRGSTRLAELDCERAALAAELEQLRAEAADLARRETDREASLLAAREQCEHLQSQLASRRQDVAELDQRRTAAAERAAVLEELENRQEGVSTGVKDLLARARGGEEPLGEICGLVADLLSVSVEVAPLVEVALGPVAQHLVAAAGGRLRAWLEHESTKLAGRVGVLWLSDDRATAVDDFEGRPGVLGRGDRFVETPARFAPLAVRLLGETWFVESLAHAEALAPAARGNARFVTLAGECLSADGTLLVGPAHANAGLISRRSQLRAVKLQLVEMESRLQSARTAAASLERQIAAQSQQVHERSAEHRAAAAALAEQRLRTTAVETRDHERAALQAAARQAMQAAEAEHAAAERALESTNAAMDAAQERLGQLDAEQADHGERLASIEADRQAVAAETMQAQVELAKCEERLHNLSGRLKQFQESRDERRRAMLDSHEQLAQAARRAEASRWSILRAESEIAELYLNKDGSARQASALVAARDEVQAQRSEQATEAQRLRGKVRKADEKLHERQLALNDILTQRSALADRFRDEYAQELGDLDGRTRGDGDEAAAERDVVQHEIDELRRKIVNLGNVNLEALAELEQLETRHTTLAAQYTDLNSAKTALEKIIAKINTDSRRLFAETLEVVRGHFQTLFRDLFGGGQADIVLEEGVDLLESGVEIVARPPGKEPRSISLLSGGEKTLTCVALLLAIFRSRPSPFCVLDEVDAALDEANIDRFTQVLQGFLNCTQFIIVTHSKKTMTAASTIYGVTMQESGVSKQVSVRFEDVSEDGQIRPERLAAARRDETRDGQRDDETQAA